MLSDLKKFKLQCESERKRIIIKTSIQILKELLVIQTLMKHFHCIYTLIVQFQQATNCSKSAVKLEKKV